MAGHEASGRKILIIRFSSLGDILLTTPALRRLRKKNPDAKIDFLTRKEFAPLLENNPDADRILAWDAKTGFEGLKNLSAMLKKENYSQILDFHGSLRSRYLCLFAGAAVSRISKNQFRRFLLIRFKRKKNYPRSQASKGPLTVAEKYILASEPQAVDLKNEDLIPSIHLSEKEIEFSEILWKDMSRGKKKILIAPGAKHFTKRWPKDRYGMLMNSLSEKFDVPILLAGGPDEIQTIDSIQKKFDPGMIRSRSLAGKLTLRETFAMISGADLFISNDSGLMHAASAFQIPQIALFGSTVKELGFYPPGPSSILLEKDLPCRPCTHIGRSECPKKHFRCMNDIQPDEVFTACLKLLS